MTRYTDLLVVSKTEVLLLIVNRGRAEMVQFSA
jgi:hypothetical protein